MFIMNAGGNVSPPFRRHRLPNLAYVADFSGEARIAFDALHADREHRAHYNRSVVTMAYGQRPEIREGMRTIADLARSTSLT